MTNSQKPALLPGVNEETAPRMSMLQEMLKNHGLQHVPRFVNRLILESSPYLLQHAENPVNWFPWGEEALKLATRLSRPLFVSIGYATCHWCHVMEVESFEDEVIARFLNENFISIKIDREERPDLDSLYMNALHAMGNQGGWPLNLFLTPEREPFYGGTYFPPSDDSRGFGFLTLLQRITEAYSSQPLRIHSAGQQVADAVRRILALGKAQVSPESSAIDRAIERYRQLFDNENGGVLGAPKFPSSLPIRLLLRQHHATGLPDLRKMAEVTLERMASGGIYDQIGGGFHRYATDSHWSIPHFEKMLYDNALLASTYLEGFWATGSGEFSTTATEILDYLVREMKDPQRGFFAATDADSLGAHGKKEEGYFFTWTPEELAQVLGPEKAPSVGTYFGITANGNFHGRSVPHRNITLQGAAVQLHISPKVLETAIQQGRGELFVARSKRPRPFRDEKMLASWNGLAISAFAKGGFFLGNRDLLNVAQEVARFIMQEMIHDNILSHSFQSGSAKGLGYLDDYSLVIAGFLDLFETTGDFQYLLRAQELTDVVQREFLDGESGGYFLTSFRHEELLAREKPAYDGAVPSGNSIMIQNLLKLYAIVEQQHYRDAAERTLSAFGSRINEAPTAVPEMLIALQSHLRETVQLVIVIPQENQKSAEPLLNLYRTTYLPNSVLIQAIEGAQYKEMVQIVPPLKGRHADGDKTMAYVCVGRACQLPTSDPSELSHILKGLNRP